ncbi:collagen alpha-1(I) chain-like [Pogoniulus pusillus]|uniref:collagen alpha-1(I) chain-like n=1 Tax=Pogoniulus pusillus TaxID=488313 RepID=UPI0030B91FBC
MPLFPQPRDRRPGVCVLSPTITSHPPSRRSPGARVAPPPGIKGAWPRHRTPTHPTHTREPAGRSGLTCRWARGQVPLPAERLGAGPGMGARPPGGGFGRPCRRKWLRGQHSPRGEVASPARKGGIPRAWGRQGTGDTLIAAREDGRREEGKASGSRSVPRPPGRAGQARPYRQVVPNGGGRRAVPLGCQLSLPGIAHSGHRSETDSRVKSVNRFLILQRAVDTRREQGKRMGNGVGVPATLRVYFHDHIINA